MPNLENDYLEEYISEVVVELDIVLPPTEIPKLVKEVENLVERNNWRMQ